MHVCECSVHARWWWGGENKGTQQVLHCMVFEPRPSALERLWTALPCGINPPNTNAITHTYTHVHIYKGTHGHTHMHAHGRTYGSSAKSPPSPTSLTLARRAATALVRASCTWGVWGVTVVSGGGGQGLAAAQHPGHQLTSPAPAPAPHQHTLKPAPKRSPHLLHRVLLCIL
jgi:hypothetical protein